MIRGLAFLAAAAFLAGPSAREDLVFTPEPGARSSKTFQRHLELRLVHEEQVFTVDGVQREEPAADGPGLALKEHDTLTVTDEVLAVEGGRITRLKRTFDELYTESFPDTGLLEPEPGSEPERGQSPLEGQTVLFTRAADTGAFTAEFAGEAAPGASRSPELLEGLELDADLTWFLPGRAVAVGESWPLEPVVFTRLSAPLGNSRIERPGDERQEEEFDAQFDAHLAGDVVCELREVRGDVATIGIVMKLDSTVDEAATDGGLANETSRYAYHLELAGELTWNIALGCAAGLQLSGDARMTLTNDQSGMLGGLDFALHSVQEFVGTLELEARIQ